MHRMRGLTLLELMATIMILASLALFAIPAFQDLKARTQATALSNHILGMVQLTRSTAVNYGTTATLCPSLNSTTCSRKWKRGLIVFLDSNKDGKRTKDETIVANLKELPEGAWIEWRAFQNPKYLQYQPSGRTNNHNGRFAYCPPNNNQRHAQEIIINKAGRARKALLKETKNYCEKRQQKKRNKR